MNMKDGIKTARYLTIGTTGVSILTLLAVPAAAWAGQYTPDAMMQNAGKSGNISATTITTDTVTSWVNTVLFWAIGIAVALFVLRIGLTAIDRLVLANLQTNAHVPFAFPNPGDERYSQDEFRDGHTPPEGWTWKRIWLNFAKNLAIIAGAWLIVQVVMGIILYVFGGVNLSS